MTLGIKAGERVLFIGDSITDCARLDGGPDGLGDGYVRLVAARLPGVAVVNRGVSGDTTADLLARWRPDCLDLRPDVLSLYVGINDTWRAFDSGTPTSTERFAANYRELLATATEALDARIILVEPFVLPVTPDQEAWHADLDPKVTAIRELAGEYGVPLVPLGAILRREAARTGNAALAEDGVHPTPRGHEVIAEAWLELGRPPCPQSTRACRPAGGG